MQAILPARGCHRRLVRQCLLTLLALTLLTTTVHAADQTGTLTYAPEDLFTMKQGSIEFWMMAPWDVKQHLPSTQDYNGLLRIMSVEGSEGAFTLLWFAGAMYRPGAGLHISIHSRRTDIAPMALGAFTAAPHEWHHLALTWRDRTMWFYLDGKLIREYEASTDLPAALGHIGSKPLVFGDPHHARGAMAIDDLRISNIAREPAELGFHGPRSADPHTTLLDNFDASFTPDGKQSTQPATSLTGVGGLPDKSCRFIEGKFGHAMALYPGP